MRCKGVVALHGELFAAFIFQPSERIEGCPSAKSGVVAGAKMAASFQWSLAALETLMAEDQMDQHSTVLRGFSIAATVGL